MEERSAETKVFNDPIHGHIELHPLCIRIIDTPQFQRLRHIKQLGASYFVFPGASHNRFEHSLGVGHLAGELVRQLRQRQNEDLRITDKDVLCVQIAGLCHDLGHGPFSHMFDAKFIPRIGGDPKWQHEDASLAMFDELVRENGLEAEFLHYCLTSTDLTFIKEQIGGPLDSNSTHDWPYKGRTEDKGFLYEVVANKRNGIDVDKWDYFARDCHHLGIRSNFDHLRFMKFARVLKVDGRLQICSRDKEVGNVYDMFYTRNTLHRRAYQHKTCTVIEEMIVEALVMADQVLTFPGTNGALVKLSDAIYDMKAYTQATDHVYHQIRHSLDPRLACARALLERIERRELYKCIGQSRPSDKNHKLQRNKDEIKIAHDIAACSSEAGAGTLDASNLVVQIISYDYGKKEKNPVDQVRFYSKANPTQAIEIRRSEVSHMLPDTFSEQFIRVYSKDRTPDKVKLVHDCFEQFCKINGYMPPKGGDPGTMELSPVKDTSASKRPCSALQNQADELPSPPQGKQRRL